MAEVCMSLAAFCNSCCHSSCCFTCNQLAVRDSVMLMLTLLARLYGGMPFLPSHTNPQPHTHRSQQCPQRAVSWLPWAPSP